MRSGKHPTCPVYSIRAPISRSASTRSAIGLSRIRLTPSSRYAPPANAKKAVSIRETVPALPTKSSASCNGKSLPGAIVHSSAFCSIDAPSRCNESSMRSVSSACNSPVRRVLCVQSAAKRSARLEIDLEPGSFTVPRACVTAGTVRTSSSHRVCVIVKALVLPSQSARKTLRFSDRHPFQLPDR